MYRSPCWCVTRTSAGNKTVVCIPPVYLIGVEKCGTQDVSKNIMRHPLVESANFDELDYWEYSLPGMSLVMHICINHVSSDALIIILRVLKVYLK